MLGPRVNAGGLLGCLPCTEFASHRHPASPLDVQRCWRLAGWIARLFATLAGHCSVVHLAGQQFIIGLSSSSLVHSPLAAGATIHEAMQEHVRFLQSPRSPKSNGRSLHSLRLCLERFRFGTVLEDLLSLIFDACSRRCASSGSG